METKDLTLAEELAVYSAYRAKIVAEDTLVNARMSWMLWAEAILFAMWGSIVMGTISHSASKQISLFALLAGLAINGIGVYAANQSRRSLNAAYSELQNVIEEYRKAYPRLYLCEGRVPSIHAGEKEFKPGFILSKKMPSIFIGMQSAAAFALIVAYFIPGFMFEG